MNVKGYLSTLIIILALFGINWEPATVPNQEIVVEFDDREVSFDEAQNALAVVKQRLETIGVKNIRVVEESDGKLKITYFSNVDVAAVKRMLAEGQELLIASVSHDGDKSPEETPTGNDSFAYELNVCEIQQYLDIDLDLEGYILEPIPDSSSNIVPFHHLDVSETTFSAKDRIDRVAYRVYRSKELLIDDVPHTIPEVRAGPAHYGIS